MKRGVPILVALSLASIALTAATSMATQVLYRSPRQLGQESSAVVRGTVSSVRSYWNDERTKIITETRVDVSETYKGAAAGTIRVLQLGGVVGKVRMTVHGALVWKPGEEVLLFLEPMRGGDFMVAGFSQGKYTVTYDQRGRAVIPDAPDTGASIVGAPGASARGGTHAPIALDQFVDRALGRRSGGEGR